MESPRITKLFQFILPTKIMMTNSVSLREADILNCPIMLQLMCNSLTTDLETSKTSKYFKDFQLNKLEYPPEFSNCQPTANPPSKSISKSITLSISTLLILSFITPSPFTSTKAPTIIYNSIWLSK